MASYIFFDLHYSGFQVALFGKGKVYGGAHDRKNGCAVGYQQTIFLSAK
jgi:hypothetical protein